MKKDIKIAQIIDTDLVVINAGSSDGVKENMRFLIYEFGDEILDPDTKTSLGKLELPKGFYKVQHVQEKISTLVAENKSKGRFAALSNVGRLIEGLDIEEKLKNEIQVGDLVKVINII